MPATVFFFVFYFALPVLTSYSKALNAPAIGPVSIHDGRYNRRPF
ncbi:hypothetical protein P9851_12175 [Geobacillus stearothermophilus]|nr:hypothetical protein [Geobacillus stearothermophilus]MED4355963.1 hypothetical protein [Geobacillus stearothermophilus]MED5077933.1 hypothetical protein [Geobacillus stearothermophilus]